MYDERLDSSQEIDRYIIKRDGRQVPFEPDKIRKAIEGANADETRHDERLSDAQISKIVNIIINDVYRKDRPLSVEEIQDLIEREINKHSYTIFLRFHDYRKDHQLKRKKPALDRKMESIIDVKIHADGSVSGSNEEVNQENSNKNPTLLSVQRDYIAGEWSRHYMNEYVLPDDIKIAHSEGIIHFHDTDFAAIAEHNCSLINLKDMFENDTKLSGEPIETPKSFKTACTVLSQVAAAVSSGQYGGQTMTLAHLAPYVDVSRQKLKKRFAKTWRRHGIEFTEEQLNKFVEDEVIKEVQDGCQTIQYQLITLHSTNGQAPFITLFMYLHEVPEGQTRDDLELIIKTMLEQRIQGIKDKDGNVLTVAFPKLIYVLQEDNIYPNSRYWNLTKLAAKCTAKRLVPDYISEKKMLELKGDVYPCMGCRSFLTPDRISAVKGNIANAKDYIEGQHKYYGRFNQGVVTINLVDVACTSHGNMEAFWEIFNERLDLCHKALRLRHERLLGTPSDVAPLLWQDGALARLKPGEPIDKLLYSGYSTLSLGYAGLAECVYRMTGQSHTLGEGQEFGLKVMQHMNDKCNEWKALEDIDYSLYGTPIESTTYKFAKCLQRRFGIIEGVTDKNYITNSYHVKVTEEIDAFEKLTKEAAFQALSPGGAISYVEVPNLQNNIQAVLTVMQHIYNTIIYAELNTKADTCKCCGYCGEIKIVKDHGKLIWECPKCGNRDQGKMQVVRRTCGYIGTQYWNQGRTQEIAERVLHL